MPKIVGVSFGTKNMCVRKDDFDWLAFEMFRADGVVMVDPIFETGASGLFHTIMDRFGPRMDTGNNFISTQIARARLAEGGPAVKVTYRPEDLHRAHDIISGKEIHGKDIQENEGKLAEMKKTQAYKDRVNFYKDAIPVTKPEK